MHAGLQRIQYWDGVLDGVVVVKIYCCAIISYTDSKMISITLLSTILICNALPTDIAVSDPRSLFHDVIKSIKIHSQLSEDSGHGNENAVSHQYDDYIVDSDHRHSLMPTDEEFIPRRNDRIELLPLRRRIPKQQDKAETTEKDKPDKDKPQEIVILIDTHKYESNTNPTTTKPKKVVVSKRPRPTVAKDKTKTPYYRNNQTINGDDIIDESENQETSAEPQPPMPHRPQNNNMSGQSQIGNRESQMVIKPTVIVNFRGTVTNRDSDIRLESRNNEDNTSAAQSEVVGPSKVQPPQNVFNINQDVHIEKTYAIIDEIARTQSDQKTYADKKDETSETVENENSKFKIEETMKSVSKVISATKTKIDIGERNVSEIREDDENREARAYNDEGISVAITIEESDDEEFPFSIRLN